jgi:hypothetical protein
MLEEIVHLATPNGRNWIWRGQRQDLPLVPKVYREAYLKGKRQTPTETCAAHLRVFKDACRGRRGSTPPAMDDDREWWALGQHNGLATPLLDWTESPFVAAFFAFEREDTAQEGNRAIYALSRQGVADVGKTQENVESAPDSCERGYMELFSPTSGENPRLISQAGLFTYGPVLMDVESWVREHFSTMTKRMLFLKVLIPDEGRANLLMYLNRMNINHMTLFPDLYGASRFTNMRLQVPGY